MYKDKTNKRAWQNAYRRRHRLQLLEIFGSICGRCGFSDYRALQVDHVNGGGSQDKDWHRLSFAQRAKYVKKNLKKFQLLCANCNWIKRAENGETR